MNVLQKKKILAFLKKSLPKERTYHILGMVRLAKRLARHHGLSEQDAELAALLHDIARCWEDQQLIRYVHQHSLKIPHQEFICKFQPVLLHSFVSAHLAKKIFGIRRREILGAVEKHSFAAMQMSAFDKLIYVADLAAPDRKFPEAVKLRSLAFKDLDHAFIDAMRIKMMHLLQINHKIYPDAVRIWNHFALNER